MRYVPNIISGIRILCSAALLLTEPLSALFFVIYAVCGASDLLDGYIARRMHYTSRLGAIFDSIADFAFFGVFLVIFLPLLQIPLWVILWVGAVILVRISSLAVGLVRYRALAFLHTYANKTTGIAIFCFPFLYSLAGLAPSAALLCGMASLSAVEELLINITSKNLSRDIKSIIAIEGEFQPGKEV